MPLATRSRVVKHSSLSWSCSRIFYPGEWQLYRTRLYKPINMPRTTWFYSVDVLEVGFPRSFPHEFSSVFFGYPVILPQFSSVFLVHPPMFLFQKLSRYRQQKKSVAKVRCSAFPVVDFHRGVSSEPPWKTTGFYDDRWYTTIFSQTCKNDDGMGVTSSRPLPIFTILGHDWDVIGWHIYLVILDVIGA